MEDKIYKAIAMAQVLKEIGLTDDAIDLLIHTLKEQLKIDYGEQQIRNN